MPGLHSSCRCGDDPGCSPRTSRNVSRNAADHAIHPWNSCQGRRCRQGDDLARYRERQTVCRTNAGRHLRDRSERAAPGVPASTPAGSGDGTNRDTRNTAAERRGSRRSPRPRAGTASGDDCRSTNAVGRERTRAARTGGADRRAAERSAIGCTGNSHRTRTGPATLVAMAEAWMIAVDPHEVARAELVEALARMVNRVIQHGKAEAQSAFNSIAEIRITLAGVAKLGDFLEDLDAAERALRGIALGRKSWLFAGSDRGGQRAAAIYSLIVTAKLNDVDPQAWLADVLARIAGHPAHRIDELLPWNWRPNAAARSQAA